MTHRTSVLGALEPGGHAPEKALRQTVATALTETHERGDDRIPPARAAATLMAALDGLTPADRGRLFDCQGAVGPW